MGTTFVDIDDRGFWMRDGFLELWLRLTALHIEDPPTPPSIATRIRDQWLLASRGYFNGCVPHDLGEFVREPEGRRLILLAIRSLLLKLGDAPDTLDAGVLNLLGFEARFNRGIEKWRLVEISQAFFDLIEGRIVSAANSTSFMPGYRERPGQIEPAG
ncbi:MAG: hypothetical protein HY901_26085 [Deltaproteobacteria bacterium]|nr:hypothetical protein [Deltaproteobacteria bacterium]